PTRVQARGCAGAERSGAVGAAGEGQRRMRARAAGSWTRTAGRTGPDRPRRRYPWATLMRRVFEKDVLVCGHCGGPRRVLDFVVEPTALRRILGHLGLEAEPPPVAPARGPPELPFADAEGDVAGGW